MIIYIILDQDVKINYIIIFMVIVVDKEIILIIFTKIEHFKVFFIMMLILIEYIKKIIMIIFKIIKVIYLIIN